MNPEKIIAAAREVADHHAKRMADAYVESVRKYINDFQMLPDYEDFIAWIMGYDWPGEEDMPCATESDKRD